MKKIILTLLSSVVITNLATNVINAEQVIDIAEITTFSELQEQAITFQAQTESFLNVLSNLKIADLTKETVQETINYLNLLTSKELIENEETIFVISTLKTTYHDLIVQENIEDTDLTVMISDYLFNLSKLTELNNLEPNQIESLWRSVKIVEKLDVVDYKDEVYREIKVKMSKLEFTKLLGESFEEDGSFKEKLYSKELQSIYKYLVNIDSEFINSKKEQYEKILNEIIARKEALTALEKIEEKRTNGETISAEEIAEVEALTNKVQTDVVREVANNTKTEVVKSQEIKNKENHSIML